MCEVIRLLIADDHDLLRKGLQMFTQIHNDFLFVGEASNGKEAVELCGIAHPDIVLMDLEMPEMDGVNATRQITETYPHIRVVALSNYDDEKLVRDAFQAGVISYVLKTTSSDELASAIRSVYKGEPILSKEIVETLIHGLKNSTHKNYGLTGREITVLKLMIEGLSNAEIAEQLYLSIPTVKKHVHQILAKFDVPNRTRAVIFAIQNNVLAAEE